MRKSGARGRIGEADQDLAAGALNLAAGEAHLSLQWLVAMPAVELELGDNSTVAHPRLMRKRTAKGIRNNSTDWMIPF